ncbi:MAG: sulfite exporter TauE/SafE family protein [Bacillota bacterium]
MTLEQAVLIFIAGVASGFVNVIGGGGSLISLPALIFMGLPSAVANGTNRIALMVQSIVAIGYFREKGFFYPRLSAILGIPALLGSILGARFALSLSDEMFNRILVIVMLSVLVLILWRPERKFLNSGEIENPGRWRLAVAILVFFGVGFYGGFIQAGVGFLIIAALALITGMSLVKINSLKVSITVIYMFSSLAVFVIGGKVDWALGFVLALGNAAGAYLGSAVSVAKGDKWIRVFLVISVLVMSAKLLEVHKLMGF